MKRAFPIIEVLMVLVAGGLLAVIPVLAIWTDRTLDFWVSYVKGEEVDVSYWLALLVTIVAPFALTVNILSEIARLCV